MHYCSCIPHYAASRFWIFRPLKLCWRKAVEVHAKKSNKIITKVNFAPIFYEAYSEVLKKEVIPKSFEKAGIYPFDPEKVDYSKFITYRRDIIKQSSTVAVDPQVIPSSTSPNIEPQIPTALLEQFEEHLFYETETAEEKILIPT